MLPYIAKVCEALQEPDLVYERTTARVRLYYKLGMLTGRLRRTYVVVLVRYDLRPQEVRTMYPSTRPAASDTLIYMRGRQ